MLLFNEHATRRGRTVGDKSLMSDPWEDVPANRRLEFKVIRKPLDRPTAAVVINVERSLPPAIANVVGAPTIFLLLTKVAETTFNTIRYFCADEPADPRRSMTGISCATGGKARVGCLVGQERRYARRRIVDDASPP